MLPSEFTERTKITLTSEEYADVEELYNGVKMDKDKFCKEWLRLRNNPLFKELSEAYCREVRRHLSDVSQLQATCKSLREEYDAYKENKASEIKNVLDSEESKFTDFAKKIVCLNLKDETKALYDIIEEELGIKFIIQTKHDNGIPLSDDEISYLVGKL